MKLKRILSGALAVCILACAALAPETALPGSAAVITAQAASSKPAVPTGFKVESTSVGTIKLSWNKMSGVKGIAIYRATSEKGEYKKIASVGGSKSSIKFHDLKEGRTYYFKLRSYTSSGGKKVYSDYTSARKITVLSEREKNLGSLKKKAPIFCGSYMEPIIKSYPLTYDMEITTKGKPSFGPDLDLGTAGNVKRLRVCLASPKKLAAKVYSDDGTEYTYFLKDGRIYMLSPEYKMAASMKIKDADVKEMLKSYEKYADIDIPDFSNAGLIVKTEKKKLYGTECICEKLTFEGVSDFELCTYVDSKSKKLKCLNMKSGGAELTMKFNEFARKVDENMFKIPSGYSVVDADEYFGG